MQTFKDITSSVFWTMIILCIVGCIAACSKSINPEQSIPTGVHVIYPETSKMILKDYQCDVIQLKDYRRNLQWDVIYYDRAITVLPGTEKPITKD